MVDTFTVNWGIPTIASSVVSTAMDTVTGSGWWWMIETAGSSVVSTGIDAVTFSGWLWLTYSSAITWWVTAIAIFRVATGMDAVKRI